MELFKGFLAIHVYFFIPLEKVANIVVYFCLLFIFGQYKNLKDKMGFHFKIIIIHFILVLKYKL